HSKGGPPEPVHIGTVARNRFAVEFAKGGRDGYIFPSSGLPDGPASQQREQPMAEQKESSVLFSLKELMNLEEDRIRQEEDGKQKFAAIAGGVGLLMVLGGVGAGVFIKIQNDKAALAQQIKEEEVRKLQEENDRLKREAKEADEAVANARAAVEKAGSDAEKK